MSDNIQDIQKHLLFEVFLDASCPIVINEIWDGMQEIAYRKSIQRFLPTNIHSLLEEFKEAGFLVEEKGSYLLTAEGDEEANIFRTTFWAAKHVIG